MVGSSPLARGLPFTRRSTGSDIRIIPARAGFTTGFPPGRLRWRDHPRSRGVYQKGGSVLDNLDGSSPLARGLRSTNHSSHSTEGIIPARAGFTNYTEDRSVIDADHPRSRGVYMSEFLTPDHGDGSSPLARGLRVALINNDLNIGIIPARAGFTPGREIPVTHSGDHPRSRGVYSPCVTWGEWMDGSSPLARGLRCASHWYGMSTGIIPARAGFTTGRCTPPVECWDHPRSRGVYCAPRLRLLSTLGSSPLARGLPQRLGYLDAAGRIIPARAGFTNSDADGLCTIEDHPRSRGVYERTHIQALQTAGSSPLARGLRASGDGVGWIGGIIPARAGFTRRAGLTCSTRRDHPRSRGVYSS